MKLRDPLLLIAVILLGVSAGGNASAKPSEITPGVGRMFLFVARQFGIPAMKASVRLSQANSDQGKQSYQIEARVESLNFGLLFRMNNRFTSTMEADSCRPIHYVREIDQGGLLIRDKKYVEAASFDTVRRMIILERKDAAGKKEISLPSDTYDPLSMFARCYLKEEIHPGRDVTLSVFDGVKVRHLLFHSEREQVASALLGEVATVRLESTTPFFSFGEKEGTIRIWYTADGRRIPVVMELDLPVGSIRFELTAIEGNP